MRRLRLPAIAFAATGLALLLGSCSSPSTEPVERRVMVIGIDGMEWDIMGPLVDEGRLPTFERLISEGAWGELRSLDILESPVIWTSIATGKVPEKHGITGFAKRLAEGAEPVPMTSNVRRVEAVWDILGDTGKSVGIVCWLATWPAEPVNGYLVTDYFNYGWELGRGVQSEHLTFPPPLADELEELRFFEDDVTDPMLARLIRGEVPPAEPRSESEETLRRRLQPLKAAIATDQTTLAVAVCNRSRPPSLRIRRHSPSRSVWPNR
jgi:hypothetical protein